MCLAFCRLGGNPFTCDGDDTYHPDSWPGSFHITKGAHAEIRGLLRGVPGQGCINLGHGFHKRCRNLGGGGVGG